MTDRIISLDAAIGVVMEYFPGNTINDPKYAAGKSLVEALSAIPAVDGWQDIEIAPRDVPILLAWPHSGGTTIGRFDTDQYAKKPRPFFSGHWKGKLWERENQPVKWQPLPARPRVE